MRALLPQMRDLWTALPKRRALVWTALLVWMALMTYEMRQTSRQLDLACKYASWFSRHPEEFPEWRTPCPIGPADLPWPEAVEQTPTPAQYRQHYQLPAGTPTPFDPPDPAVPPLFEKPPVFAPKRE